MAAKHILSLEIPSVTNCDIFSVKDTSQYAENLPIECPELLITPPGFNAPYMIEVQPGFNLNLTPCALGLQTYNCDQSTSPFPDGVYTIAYRVQPHDKVVVQYHYLRVTEILKMYHEKLCELDITPCEPTFSKKKLLSELTVPGDYYISPLGMVHLKLDTNTYSTADINIEYYYADLKSHQIQLV